MELVEKTFSGSPHPSTPYLLVPGEICHTNNRQVITRVGVCILLSMPARPGSFPVLLNLTLCHRYTEGQAISLHGPNQGAIRCLVNAIAWQHIFTTVVITVFLKKSTSWWQTPVWPADADLWYVARFLLASIPKFFCRRVGKQTTWREMGRAGAWTLSVALWWKYRTWCQKFRA